MLLFCLIFDVVAYTILMDFQVSTVGEEMQYNPRLTKDEVVISLMHFLICYDLFAIHVCISNWLKLGSIWYQMKLDSGNHFGKSALYILPATELSCGPPEIRK